MKKVSKVAAVEPAYNVDITSCDNAFDVQLAFAQAKQEAGVPLTKDDLIAFIEDAINRFIDEYIPIIRIFIEKSEAESEDKLPWYKRLWNKLFKKNK